MITVKGPPAKAIMPLAGKSPSGRTPMISKVFKLITRPLICGATRSCARVITVAPTPFCAIPNKSRASSESQKRWLKAKRISELVQTNSDTRRSKPLYLKSPSE